MNYRVEQALFEVPKHLNQSQQESREIYNQIYMDMFQEFFSQNREFWLIKPKDFLLQELKS